MKGWRTMPDASTANPAACAHAPSVRNHHRHTALRHVSDGRERLGQGRGHLEIGAAAGPEFREKSSQKLPGRFEMLDDVRADYAVEGVIGKPDSLFLDISDLIVLVTRKMLPGGEIGGEHAQIAAIGLEIFTPPDHAAASGPDIEQTRIDRQRLQKLKSWMMAPVGGHQLFPTGLLFRA